ncbi:MAG: hypothetical protein QGG40_06475 [Myxococcota bacterium]|nr:hypothetical protein [Myxococcota bacterium]
MNAKIAVLGLASTLGSTALAGEFTLGELNTGATLENQDIVVSPLLHPTSIGMTDNVELITCLICNAFVANAGVEYGIFREEDSMLSATAWLGFEYPSDEVPDGAAWLFGKVEYSKLLGEDWLTIALGTGMNLSGGEPSLDSVPVSVYYLMLDGDQAWQFELWSDPYAISQGADPLSTTGLSGLWLKAMEKFRFGVGLSLQGADGFLANAPDPIAEALVDYPLPVILTPDAQLSWRF